MEKRNIPYYIISIAIFILLKVGYKFANNNSLTFLLKPTNKLVGFLTGSDSCYNSDSGYFYQQLNIAIDKSCAGFNFWILTFLMLVFLILKHNKINRLYTIPFALVTAYILSIFVNTSRIFTSIVIQNKVHNFGNQHIIHEAIGVITNLSFLILIYLLTDKILLKIRNHAKLA